jgi:peptidoglycan/LPS O-acetylase OafA/YrhL
VIAVVGSNIVAALSYRFIKKPFLRLKKRFEAAPTQASRSAVVQ